MICAHHPYYPGITNFLSLFIDCRIPDVSTYDKTRRQRATTTKRKSTNDQNGPKRKSKNKRKTEITQDEQVSDTDTEQQTSEHETFFFYFHSRVFCVLLYTFCSYTNCSRFELTWKYQNDIYILTLSNGRSVENIIGYDNKHLIEEST